MADDKEEELELDNAGGGKKKLIIIIVAVVVLYLLHLNLMCRVQHEIDLLKFECNC